MDNEPSSELSGHGFEIKWLRNKEYVLSRVPFTDLQAWVGSKKQYNPVFHYTESHVDSFMTSRGIWQQTWAFDSSTFTAASAASRIHKQRPPNTIIVIRNKPQVFFPSSKWDNGEWHYQCKNSISPEAVMAVWYLPNHPSLVVDRDSQVGTDEPIA